ncbi:hypothetical protein BGZ76_002164 [Entomortierella beljakovae]|nr:hypothetical protein BGZ76_002164 [Entomortierella beljakovae]
MSIGFPFVPVKRVNVNQEGVNIESEVEAVCVEEGTPLVLEGWHKHPKWKRDLFTFQYIEAKYGNEEILCRDLARSEDVPMSMKEYIRKVHSDSLELSSQIENPDGAEPYELPLTPASSSPLATGEEDRAITSTDEISAIKRMDEDMAMEDVQCTAVNTHSESTTILAKEDITILNKKSPVNQDAGSSLDRPRRSNRDHRSRLQQLLYAKDVTCPEDWGSFLMDGVLPEYLGYMRNNDLNTLNSKIAAENLMIYIGQAGTWTPAHIDQCGAIGHNIMAWADDDSSSIWFMIRAEDKAKAEELWKSFGHPLEYEGFFASVDQLRQAKFPIYVVNQMIGDFVMVPSLGYHQVINLGKATIKVSWNRLTAHCLKAAVNVVLPRYREIARPEAYRIKTIIRSALEAWTKLLKSQSNIVPISKESFCQSFKDILQLFKSIVEEEWIDLDVLNLEIPSFSKPKRLENAAPAVCDFCSSDLWNREFHCLKCPENNDNYDICLRCFALGRGCMHRATSMEFVETFSMKSCQRLYSEAILAWNNSEVLSGCKGYEPIANDWINGKNNVEHHVIQEPDRQPVLSFTRPEDDARNRGGVSDNMIRSFASYDGGEDEEDGLADVGGQVVPMAVAPAHGGRRFPPKKLASTRQESEGKLDLKRKRNLDTDALSRGSSFNSNTAVSIADTDSVMDSDSGNIRVTRAELESLMGLREEMVVRYAYANGLRRTIQSIKTKQEMAQSYYRDLFQMDNYFMNKGKDAHENFRKDILESHSSKKRAAMAFEGVRGAEDNNCTI